jgi:hypothetical protein
MSYAFTTPVATPPRQITGRNLAHARRNPVERALLAADLASGRVVLVEPTMRQIVGLTGASPSYAAAAAALDEGERRSVSRGWRPMIPTQQVKRDAAPIDWARIDDSALVNGARALGTDRMLAAAVAAERAGTNT